MSVLNIDAVVRAIEQKEVNFAVEINYIICDRCGKAFTYFPYPNTTRINELGMSLEWTKKGQYKGTKGFVDAQRDHSNECLLSSGEDGS